MTWGMERDRACFRGPYSDAKCPWCKSTMPDDRDPWPTTHMEYRCRRRTLWNRFWFWMSH